MTIAEKVKTVVRFLKEKAVDALTAATAIELIFYLGSKGAVFGAEHFAHFLMGEDGGYVIGAIIGGASAGGAVFIARLGIIYFADLIISKLGGDAESLEIKPPEPFTTEDFIAKVILAKENFVNLCALVLRNTQALTHKNLIWDRAWKIKCHTNSSASKENNAKYTTLDNILNRDEITVLSDAPTKSTSQESISSSDEEKDIESQALSENQNETIKYLADMASNFFSNILQHSKIIYLKIRVPFFKYIGGAVGIGAIIYCSYYGGMILGTAEHTVIAFISGALLGASLSTAFVYFAGKSLIAVDERIIAKISNDKEQQLDQELKQFRIQLKNLKQQFHEYKNAIERHNNIIQMAMDKNAATASSSNPSPNANFPELHTPNNAKNHSAVHIISVDTDSDITTENTPSLLQKIKNITFLIVGVPSAGITIISSAYISSLIGAAVSKGIPLVNELGGYIAGGLIGATFATGGVYMCATGLIDLDKILSGNDEKSKLLRALTMAENKLRHIKEECMRLYSTLREKIPNLPMELTNDDTNDMFMQRLPEQSVAAIDILGRNEKRISLQAAKPIATAKMSKRVNQSDEETPLLLATSTLTASVNDALGLELPENTVDLISNDNIFYQIKEFVQETYHQVKTFVKDTALRVIAIIIAIAAPLLIIISCGYYGFLIGGSLNTVTSDVNSLYATILGTVLGASYGGLFVVLTAKALSAGDKALTNNKYNEIPNAFNTLDNELTNTKTELLTLQRTIKSAEEAWNPTFDITNTASWERKDSQREVPLDSSNNFSRKSGKHKSLKPAGRPVTATESSDNNSRKYTGGPANVDLTPPSLGAAKQILLAAPAPSLSSSNSHTTNPTTASDRNNTGANSIAEDGDTGENKKNTFCIIS